MDDAAYYHVNVYVFDVEARNEVVKRLNAGVKNVSVRCWYDVEKNWFCLSCPPGDVGPIANEVLEDVIENYTHEELLQAERDGRPPHVRRFPESDLDWLDVTVDDPNLTLPEIGSIASCEAAPEPKLPIKRHFIAIKPGAAKNLHLFHLRDLPKGSLERILMDEDKDSERTVSLGLTPRAVKFDAKTLKWIFNGRISKPIEYEASSFLKILDSIKYPVLVDTRQPESAAPNVESVSTDEEWRVKNGTPVVQKFLSSIGQTELLDPNEMPEMPKDTENFVARPEYGPSSMVGRARIPKGGAPDLSSKDHGDVRNNDDDEDDEEDQIDFNSLLAGKSQAKAAPDHDQVVNTTPVAPYRRHLPHPSNDQASDEAPTFAGLLRGPGSQPTTKSPLIAMPADSSAARMQSFLDDNISATPAQSILSPQPSLCDSRTVTKSYNTIPDYHQNYASVDNIGLTIAASIQAGFEVENQSPRKPRGNKYGIASRRFLKHPSTSSTSATDANSTMMSVSSGDDFQRSRSCTNEDLQSSECASLRTPSGRRDWTNKTSPLIVPEGNLIDGNAASTAATTRPPPGLDFRQNDTAPASPAKNIPASGPTEDSLIEFSDGEDAIIDRLAEDQVEAPKLYTMRQKKPKNTGGSKKKPAAKAQFPKVQLERPDPAHPHGPPSRLGPLRGDGEPVPAGSVTTRTAIDSNPQTPGKIATFIEGASSSGDSYADKIVVRFGKCLVRHKQDADFFRGVTNTDEIEARILSEADEIDTKFIARLTTDSDAGILLNHFPGALETTSMYDINIKTTTDGNLHIIRIDKDNRKEAVKIFEESHDLTAWIMYGMHEYDAEFRVQKIVDDRGSLRDACQPLINSLTAGNPLPTMRGFTASSVFNIESIVAKKVFFKTRTDGIRFEITEVQKLPIQPLVALSSSGYTFLAAAEPRSEAIEKGALWFEAALTSTDLGVDGANALENVAEEMVAMMDGIGHSNQGPWAAFERGRPEVPGSNHNWVQYGKW